METLGEIERLGYFDKYEVIVVENTDDAIKRSEVIAKCQSQFPAAVVLESEIAGLSRARNIGLVAAKSDLVAYLDDDATPCDGWAEAILDGFRNKDVAYVGGPIDPRWEEAPPSWMPPELYDAFTVLDLGTKDQAFGPGQFAYGANMAFRKSLLQNIGGFDEALGRQRHNLHGEEDIAIQRRLGSSRGVYKVAARVKHFIPRSRANWHWLVKRFVWQGFSEISQTGTLEAFHETGLGYANTNRIVRGLYDGIMAEPRTKKEALERLEFLRAAVGGLFHARTQDIVVDLASTAPVNEPVPSVQQIAPRLTTAPLAPVVRDVPVFIEFGKSHSYLMDAYGDIPGARFVNFPNDCWGHPSAAAADLREYRSKVQTQQWRPLFLTIDWVLYSPEAIEQLRYIGGVGILHRTYDSPKQIEALKRLSDHVQLASYSQVTANWVRATTSRECTLLKHPPLYFKNVRADRVRALRDGKFATRKGRPINVALIGEVRPGKGFERAVEEIASSETLRSGVRLWLAGGASSAVFVNLKSLVQRSGVACEFNVRPRKRDDHRGVSDVEFTQIIQVADIMLFPYSGDEAGAMSGHLVDSVFAGCRVLASRESAMRSMVEAWPIGGVFSVAEPGSLANAVTADMARGGFVESEDLMLDTFAAQFSIEEVNRQLVGTLRK